MRVYDVGKISPKGCIQIETTYVCKAEQAHLENYWKLIIPASCFPFMAEKLHLETAINLKFSDINNSDHYFQHYGNSITLGWVYSFATYKNIDPKKDIELIYYKPAPQEPFIIVQKDPRVDRYSFHLSYKPDNTLYDLRGADQAGEFIILLDRSGSMYEKINIAIQAVALFIRSLPENCYFNVISFGSRWEKMFECSQKYNQSSADEAYRIVIQYKNNMGGTDLLKPLESILEQERIRGCPLNVFIVTDANVWDDKVKIVNLIEKHKNNARINTIGICTNEPYIHWLARMGGGTSQEINTLYQINPAVLSSLKQALYPAITDIRLSDPSLFDFFWPREPFSIFPGQKIEISGIFKEGIIPKSI
ncbi:unnamed protein product [Blepharisma stoltei]|uniref:VWFA domain-containing protein n=1 Tax=Blepharisma stoltei TaxID=1481888 RepID=A0AAU9I4H5_9CILI|nr:unnamed protein product [Blepharisma stoltei]